MPRLPPQGHSEWDACGLARSSQDRHRQVNRTLDNVPVRNSLRAPHNITTNDFPLLPPDLEADGRDHQIPAEGFATSPSRAAEPHLPPQPRPDEDSYSPTASEFDALEESICDYETQSTLAEDASVSQRVPLSIPSSASHVQDDDGDGDETQSDMPRPSRPSSVDDLEPQACRSLEDRLRSVWRKSFPTSSTRPGLLLRAVQPAFAWARV